MNWLKLIFSIIISWSAGILALPFTISAIPTWYENLNKPFFTPPNWLFSPVWTLLYIMMGVSLYLVWISKSKPKKSVIALFMIQLLLNFGWTASFFGLKNLGLALLIIIVLWLCLVVLIRWFYKISRTSAYLLVPYLLWISFAGLLNLAILILN